MRTVVDAPVASVPTQKRRGIRQGAGDARDPVRHLVLLFAWAGSPTLDAADLSYTGPIKMLGQTCRSFQMTAFEATMPFVESFDF
jgi:hypothetical protein